MYLTFKSKHFVILVFYRKLLQCLSLSTGTANGSPKKSKSGKKHSFVEFLVCSGGCSFLLIFNYCSIHSYGSSNSPQTRPQIFIVLGPRLTFARTFAFKEMAEPARRVASLLWILYYKWPHKSNRVLHESRIKRRKESWKKSRKKKGQKKIVHFFSLVN